jgi:hypothetical protein
MKAMASPKKCILHQNFQKNSSNATSDKDHKLLSLVETWLQTKTNKSRRVTSEDSFSKNWRKKVIFGGVQGDQIGRIFAQWANVYFGQLLQIYRSIQHILAPLFH